MIRWLLKSVGITVLLALSTASYGAEKLNILCAQWDPDNYLQETATARYKARKSLLFRWQRKADTLIFGFTVSL